MAKEIERVNRIRRRARLTIALIAREMGIDRGALHRALKSPGRRPWDTTLEAMRVWADKHRNRKPERRTA